MPLQIPHPNAALHLYRHILREATYLPPLARPATFEHIKSRFRQRRSAQDPERYVKVAHRQLRFMRAANAGHDERMVRICLLATGRLGRRRRELAHEYLASSAATEAAAPTGDTTTNSSVDAMRRLSAAAWGRPEKPGNGHGSPKQEKALPPTCGPTWLENWDLEKVRILGESQHNHQENMKDWVKFNSIRRTVDPRRIVIQENCWGNTLKPKQMTRKLQKHWISVLSHLLPPLPQEEWNMLKALAQGTASEAMWKIPSRRPVAVSNDASALAQTEALLWAWEKHATVPIRKLERKNSRRMQALSGSSNDDPQRHGPPIGVRVPKARSLKRGIYSRVWQASPVISTSAKGKITVVWGGSDQQIIPIKATTSDLQFFRGVDMKGKILK